MRNNCSLSLFIFNVVFISLMLASCTSENKNTAIIPIDKLQYTWWQKRHEGIIEKNDNNPQLILIGNSILHTLDYPDRKVVWEKYLDKYQTLNLGFSGDRTENVIWRLLHGELEKINPKVALLLIGTNNTDGNNYPTINYPDELRDATWKICEIIRNKLPNTEIILLAILPYGKHRPNFRDSINQKTNEFIAQFPEQDSHIHYINIGNKFLNEDGNIIKKLMPDYLHPNVEGHMLMFDSIKDEIEKFSMK